MWSNILLIFISSVGSFISILLFSNGNANSDNNEINNNNNNENNNSYVLAMRYKDEELNALEKFRPMVDDVLEKDFERTDQFLIRWIRACQFDLNAANEMLRKAQKWRKDYKMDTILLEKFPLLEHGKYNPCDMNGVDNDGNPVFFLRLTSYDTRKLLMSGLKYDLTRKMSQCLERVVVKLRELTMSTGKDISQAVGIVDASGYNLKQHACISCISLYLDFLRDGQNFFPEYLKLIVVVNAPKIGKPLFDIAKPFMISSTLKALRIFGSDKREWTSFLLAHIPSNQLPYDFGGTANL